MYHPSRGGVRGGRDQFSWDDVKADKHRENYIGHSVNAPVGRWQKGKDLFWYARDKRSQQMNPEAAKEEIRRIKEEEEKAMLEALGLAPKRAAQHQGNRLDKHEFSELVKRGSTADDLGAGHAEAAHVQGLGFSRGHQPWKESSSSGPVMSSSEMREPSETRIGPKLEESITKEEERSKDERSQKKRHHEDKKREKHDRHEKRHSRNSDGERKRHRRDKEKRRHDSD
ncbi:unnamed protein product [Cuscuta campestris]|uniref:Multiple myeloma tumor-associated protein 2-like N-terminal domain-containing protein n=2 Tax=Cuscuta sect. Cleistogrammica TaxID=1824901 RepID=A0A484N7L1_9ASTE|nr:hypothetical protein DM860_003983 [Cuscuta australis]VFQ96496.1 unnamed protein product [Cuscuta campestris]